ncbi:MAG: hypothetical protein H6R47_1380 [Proteobacteria bacterium]|nr:hypothetical protein [Pseudomonadota bacterium]
MQIRNISAAFLLSIAVPVVFAADFPGELKVTMRTSDCDGASGMGSVNVDHISRIQPYACPNGRKLKQVYEVFTVTEDEAVKVEAQIQHIMDVRQKALEQTRPIVIDR